MGGDSQGGWGDRRGWTSMLGVTIIYVLPYNIASNEPAIVVRGEDGIVKYARRIKVDGSCEVVQTKVEAGEAPTNPHVVLRTYAHVEIVEE